MPNINTDRKLKKELEKGIFIDIVGFPQKYNYSCGPAVIRTVLHNLRIDDIDEKEIIKVASCTPDSGTHPKDLVNTLKHFGVENIKVFQNASIEKIEKFTKEGSICIVDWTSSTTFMRGANKLKKSKEEGHYSVVVGINSKYIILHDPDFHADNPNTNGYRIIDQKKFEKKWTDYEIEDGKKVIYNHWLCMIPVDQSSLNIV